MIIGFIHQQIYKNAVRDFEERFFYKSKLGFFSFSVPWKVQLVEYQGSSMTTNGGLNNASCKALFTGPVEAYDDGHCQCQSNAFVDENKAGCRK